MAFLTATNCLTLLLIVLAFNDILCVDLNYTEIYTVNDDTRFTTLNPYVKLIPLDKRRSVKGNVMFFSGERILGDHILLTYLDETQFTKSEDIEVALKYPAKGENGSVITFIEIYALHSGPDADAFFYGGGIGKRFVQLLLACNHTLQYSYEIFVYGY